MNQLASFCSLFFLVSCLLFVQCENRDLSKNDWTIIQQKDEELKRELAQRGEFTKRSCPNNCGNHGTCLADKCRCDQGWAGEDCSYQVTPLLVNRPTNGHVNRFDWNFYSIDTVAGSGLTIIINETSPQGDVDLYMRKDEIPSKEAFDYRDITTRRNFEIAVDNAGTTTWYIGTYGYFQTTYNITAKTTGSECPEQNNCNPPNGECIAPGICVCSQGYAGSDCSYQINTAEFNKQYNSNLQQGSWAYYQVQINQEKLLLINVQETSSEGDVDVYVKKGGIPDESNWDYRDININKQFSVSIADPEAGAWYIGFRAFRAVSFNFQLQQRQECPNNCSRRGNCVNNHCNCNSGFQGEYCERMVANLPKDVTVPGYVSENSWNYFKYQSGNTESFTLTVNEIGTTGDCDLYVKSNADPTQIDFDYRDIGFNKQFSLVVDNPGDSEWHIGVFGYKPCNFTLRLSVDASCPGNPPCSGHGSCQAGVCNCQNGWSGQDCSIARQQLQNGQKAEGSLHNPVDDPSSPSWAYYSISIVNSTYLAIDLREKSTVGKLWLFASKGATPDEREHDEADQETNTQFHHIHIEFDEPQTDTWIIGVNINPFAVDNVIEYDLAAWYPPF